MMNVDSTISATTLSKADATHNSKSPSTLLSKPTTQQRLTNMGLLSTFSISSSLPNTETTKTKPTLHNANNATSQRQTSCYELKIKLESVGIQPEHDDDLDMCPARTRAFWPRELIPWWQPTQQQDRRPPYSYATLIAYSILISQDGRLLLNDIYQWISEKYPFYSLDQRGWQNSIRHNLSLNKKWFLKVDRRPTQANPGKGCYWTLVPGTEEMFIENITQAGGHHRKHHDIGLTAELSRGHCNNIMDKQQQQQQQQTPLVNKSTEKLTLTTPVASKSYKPSTPYLTPMYSTFRMTSTGIESIATDTSSCKKRTKLHQQDDGKYDDPFDFPAGPTSSTSSKRARLDDDHDDTQPQPADLFTAIDDDIHSDCDSGVDVGNEHGGDNIKNNTSMELSSLEFVSTDERARPYNVLGNFLDQLPLPYQQHTDALPSTQWDTTGLHSYTTTTTTAASSSPVMIPATGTFGFMDSCGIDPLLGCQSLDYYSNNGFYYMNDGHATSGAADLKCVYPSLLASKFGAGAGVATLTEDSLTMMPAMETTSKNNSQESQHRQQYANNPSRKKNTDSLMVHANGGDPTGDEEMVNAYLKFEDDDPVCISNPLPIDITDPGKVIGGSTFMAPGYQLDEDYLSYPFATMCDLLKP